MFIDLAAVCTDPPIRAPEPRQNTVHVIGDILPLVIAKYGIDCIDHDSEAVRKPVPIPLG
jgi:hypothetical protein